MSIAVRFQDVVPPPPADDWPGPLGLEVPDGAFCVITTIPSISLALLRLCIGLREPLGGRVEVLGAEPGRLDRWSARAFRRRLGVGFDEPAGLISNLTLRMNTIVPILYSGAADLGAATRLADETLEACGLMRWANVRPADAPPDVRKLAVAARAIAREPELLLLEEPLASLRDTQAHRLLSLCRKKARTVLVMTTEREGPLFGAATMTASIDEHGFRVDRHEVGIV